MFSMLGIVLANNFVMMFIFWELVGVSSYILIGHWFERARPPTRRKKAFITNRHRRLRFHARHPDGLERDWFVSLSRNRRDGELSPVILLI
jgi:hypothetical protein